MTNPTNAEVVSQLRQVAKMAPTFANWFCLGADRLEASEAENERLVRSCRKELNDAGERLQKEQARVAELERLIKIEQEDCLTYSNSEDAALARVERLEWGLKTSDGAHDITLDELNKAEARIKELEESDKMAAEIIQAKSDCIVGLQGDVTRLREALELISLNTFDDDTCELADKALQEDDKESEVIPDNGCEHYHLHTCHSSHVKHKPCDGCGPTPEGGPE